jgi:hypothetical protein
VNWWIYTKTPSALARVVAPLSIHGEKRSEKEKKSMGIPIRSIIPLRLIASSKLSRIPVRDTAKKELPCQKIVYCKKIMLVQNYLHRA